MSTSTKTRRVPASALGLALPYEAGEVSEAEGVKRSPIRLTAVSGEPFEHWFWERMVIDVAGMSSKATVSLDYCHDPDEIIGFGRVVKDNGQLTIEGELVSVGNDRANEVMAKGAAGVPYEASVKFDALNNLALELYEAGTVASVNGRSIEGPVTVLRKSMLRGVAVCPYGADPYTNSEFSADDKSAELTITTHHAEEAEMSETTARRKKPAAKPKAAAKPEEMKTEPASDTEQAELTQKEQPRTVDDPAPDPKPEAKPDAKPPWQAQLADYTQRFGGELAAKWLGEGKPLVDCYGEFVASLREQHAAELSARDERIEAAEKAAAELQSKLDSLSLGEAEPASTVPGESDPAKSARVAELATAMPESLAKFAAGIRMPKSSSDN